MASISSNTGSFNWSSTSAWAGGVNGAAADNLFGLLDGDGLYPNDPQVEAMVPEFISLRNGSITGDDVDKALYVSIGYPSGDTPPTIEAIQAARAQMARQAAFASLRAAADAEWAPVNALHNLRGQKLNTLLEGGSDVPADLAALDAAEVG